MFDPCWLDQARRLKLRRHSSTPPDAASQVPKLCEPPVGSAPRETSGTEGSNPPSSSGESSANLTWLHGIARRGRSPGPFFVGMRLIPPMCGSKLTDGGPRSLSCNQ